MAALRTATSPRKSSTSPMSPPSAADESLRKLLSFLASEAPNPWSTHELLRGVELASHLDCAAPLPGNLELVTTMVFCRPKPKCKLGLLALELSRVKKGSRGRAVPSAAQPVGNTFIERSLGDVTLRKEPAFWNSSLLDERVQSKSTGTFALPPVSAEFLLPLLARLAGGREPPFTLPLWRFSAGGGLASRSAGRHWTSSPLLSVTKYSFTVWMNPSSSACDQQNIRRVRPQSPSSKPPSKIVCEQYAGHASSASSSSPSASPSLNTVRVQPYSLLPCTSGDDSVGMDWHWHLPRTKRPRRPYSSPSRPAALRST
mmetsp:Transcript_39236/g.103834  ORF Transcript_39236/g.103834 Transcript_39236/m.103834 type:complete len:315 (-) Transcript_39236:1458-2402(-)